MGCSCCGCWRRRIRGSGGRPGRRRRRSSPARPRRHATRALLRHRGFEDRQQWAAIPDTLPGLNDRALLLVDFTAARARMPGSKHAKPCRSDGVELLSALGQDRSRRAPHKGRLPVSCTDRYPVKAPDAWLAAATITEGRLFRQICRLPSRRRAKGVRSKPAPAPYRVGYANSFALIVQRWTGRAGFDRRRSPGTTFGRRDLGESPRESASRPQIVHSRAIR